jgi:hypothetical protein
MGVPASEVGYTSATIRRETTKSMTDMLWHWIKKNTSPFTNSSCLKFIQFSIWAFSGTVETFFLILSQQVK